ncbi:MFS transporter [Georgenia sp. 10Sc9-8]|uniref:MFS transporter n=1 Tax=Georgenia halotolerans TaxID=3028317 RepID=A0ABT5TZD6_9MICO|nr:MFS transporter [Georgenia halotolerans]
MRLAAFWLVACAFTATMAFATVPTPLYRIYQEAGNYGQVVAAVIFCTYAVGVLISLVLAGHLSDLYGRKPIMLAAVALSVVAAVVFLLSTALPVVLLGRLLCGLAIGLVTTTATAYLADLYQQARPARMLRVAEITSTAGNLGGLGIGAWISGVAAAWSSTPLRTPYLVFLAILLAMVPAVLMAPETVRPPRPRPPYRVQLPGIPHDSRALFWAAAAAAGVAFSITALFASQAPNLVADVLHTEREDLSGILSLVLFSSAAVAQIFLARGAPARQVLLGLTLLVAGIVATYSSVVFDQLAALFLGAVVAGMGAGVALKGAIAAALSVSEPERRGETLTSTFVVAYLGLTLPALGYSALAEAVGRTSALAVFAGYVTVGAVAIGVVLTRQGEARAPAR